MHFIKYNGTEFKSWNDCCKSLGINYNTFRRLCRHYVRASNDPAVAIDWLTGKSSRRVNEPKTFKYNQDAEQAQSRYFDRITSYADALIDA